MLKAVSSSACPFTGAEPQSAALASFVFGGVVPEAADAQIGVPLDHLDGPQREDWIGGQVAARGSAEGIAYRSAGDWLIGTLHLHTGDDHDVETLTHEAYRRLQAFLAHSHHPYLLRTWNFLSRLNQGEGDDERYRRFCVGRHRAIVQPGFEAGLPAATVIGSRVPGLHLSFLAGRAPGVPVENPRQTPAFRYPRDYGPISPSFSRATRVGRVLLVSGTAAVVGHATRHPHDALAQLDEIDANLRALLAHAACELPAGGAWSAHSLRVYLRRPADLPALQPRLRAVFGSGPAPSVLRGDISRADLMIEVEGVWTFRPASGD